MSNARAKRWPWAWGISCGLERPILSLLFDWDPLDRMLSGFAANKVGNNGVIVGEFDLGHEIHFVAG